MDWVAVYGATLATAVALWDGYRFVRARRPKVEVDAGMGLIMPTIEAGDALLALKRGDDVVDRIEWRSDVTVVNRGQSKQFVQGVFLHQRIGDTGVRVHLTDYEFPISLEPDESAHFVFVDDTTDVDLAYPILAVAELSNGKTFESTPFGPAVSEGAYVMLPEKIFNNMTEKTGRKFFIYEVNDPT